MTRKPADETLEQIDAPLRRFLTRVGGQSADDLAAETRLILLRRLRAGDRIRHPTAFALRVAWNQVRRLGDRPGIQPWNVEADARFSADPTRLRDLRQWILSAFERLDRLDRALLALRHGEELSHREIADVLDLPPGSISDRLQRAESELRRWLRQLGDDDPPPMLGALLPLVLADGPPRALTTMTGTATTVFAGALVMKKTMLIAAVVIILASSISGVLWFASDDNSQTPATESRLVPEPIRGQQSESPKPTEERGPARKTNRFRDPGPAPNKWNIEISTRRGIWGTLADCPVRARLYAGYDTTGATLLETDIVTDATGRTMLSLGRPQETVTLELAPRRPRFVGYPRTETVISGDSPPDEIVLFVMPIDGKVHGAVADAHGRPLPDALIRVRREVFACNDQGRWEFDSSSASDRTIIAAWAPGYAAEQKVVVPPKPGEATRIDFKLKKGIVIEGVVRDLEGEPISNATVRSYDAPHRPVTQTDAVGRYRLESIPPKRDGCFVRINHPAFIEVSENVKGDGDVWKADFRLARGSSLSGQVVDSRGAPVPEVRIVLARSFNRTTGKSVFTDSAGKFQFQGVSDFTFVTAYRQGFAPVLLRRVPVTKPLRIVLQPGRSVSGVTVDADGRAIKGVAVDPYFRAGVGLPQRRWTDHSGRFVLTDLPHEGELTVSCDAQGFVPAWTKIASDQDHVRIVMSSAGRVSGRVVDDRTSEPLASFRVRVVPPELREGEKRGGTEATWYKPGVTFADTDGLFSLKRNHPLNTVFGFEVTAEGYGPTLLPRVFPSKTAEPVVVRMKAAAGIAGTVVSAETGSPLPNAQIRMLGSLLDGSGPRRKDPERLDPIVTTDADGGFRFDSAPAALVWLEVDHRNHPVFHAGPYRLVPGKALRSLLVEVPAGATIVGTCLDLDGQPQTGVIIALRQEAERRSGLRSKRALTDEKGRFRFEGVAPGVCFVSRYEKFGRLLSVVHRKQITLAASDTKDVTVSYPGRATLEGAVAVSPAIPDGVLVRVRRKPDQPEERVFMRYGAIRNGRFSLHGLAAGTYSIRVAHSEEGRSLHGQTEAVVGAGGTQEVTLPLTWTQH